MAKIKPFKGIRPNKNRVEEVISLPYDVMNRKEAEEMAQGNPHSFLHICRSEIDLPEMENPYNQHVYDKARENIEKFLKEGTFIQDAEETYYIYRQVMNGNVQTGLVACASLDDYQNNVIKKHELTREEKEQDRINHFDTCNANTEPVFLTYPSKREINILLEDHISTHESEYDLITDDGVGHQLWCMKDSNTNERLTHLFQGIPALYIADGHHRSASASKVSLMRREEFGEYTGQEEFNFFMAVIFPSEDLKVFDYNRVVKDINGYDKEGFLKAIMEQGFSVKDMGIEEYRPEEKHSFSMYLEGHWYKVKAKEDIIPREDVIGELDVSILQDNILEPLLGIENPRRDKRIDFVGGIRGLGELKKRVENDMTVAFAVYPVEVEDLIKVSDENLVMPPKSTWFEPKLGSGLFIHSLEDK